MSIDDFEEEDMIDDARELLEKYGYIVIAGPASAKLLEDAGLCCNGIEQEHVFGSAIEKWCAAPKVYRTAIEAMIRSCGLSFSASAYNLLVAAGNRKDDE